MCNWCEKETIGKPIQSGYFLGLICEHCGGNIDKKITYKNYRQWIKEYYEKYIGPKQK